MVHPSNAADRLISRIKEKKAPIVVGLDPVIERIPAVYFTGKEGSFAGAASAVFEFNRDIIDAVYETVPAVKPQIAFYEMYGHHGIKAFEDTVHYAKAKGLTVIEDGKRNDVGNTASAYAKGHLGQVPLPGKMISSPFDVDFLTVSSFLGSESLEPFVKTCVEYGKGIFVLVKTSNSGNGLIQDALTEEGITVSNALAKLVAGYGQECIGACGYSPIGAVVGATYPQ